MSAIKHRVNFLKRELRQRIMSGDLPVGSRVPSEAQLVEQTGATRSQARKALRELEEEGLLSRKRGSGSYVLPADPDNGHMVAGSQDTVRIAVPEYGSRYVRLVLEGFMERMLSEGMKVVTTYENFSGPGEEAAFINLLGHMDMAGVAMWVMNDTPEVREALALQRRQGLPIVLIDRCIPEVDTDVAASDNEAIGHTLCRALLDRGHRHIGFVTSEKDTAHTIVERLEGYGRALREAGLPVEDRFVVRFDETCENHASEVNAVMAHRDHPTAFVCVHDNMAMWIETELERLGWTADQGFEVACVADFDPRRGGHFPTHYTRQNGHQIGVDCAGLLLARVNNPSAPAKRLLSQPGPVHFEKPSQTKGGESGTEADVAPYGRRIADDMEVAAVGS
jgi:GntR family transcriptional regulator, arabinose operon transcriptional repressor